LTTFDKAKAEVAVQLATRWIAAKPHHRRFFSLAAIRDLVTQLNSRVMRHLGTSRRALFDVERPRAQGAAGRALPLRGMEAMQGQLRLSCRRLNRLFEALEDHKRACASASDL
jgi:hypothetical protein